MILKGIGHLMEIAVEMSKYKPIPFVRQITCFYLEIITTIIVEVQPLKLMYPLQTS